MYRNQKIGVVIPAYDEEEFVGDVIETVPAFADRIYPIDDGSTDRTWEIIQRRARRENAAIASAEADGVRSDRRVVPVRHESNRGVGGAIKTGYHRAYEDGMDVVAVAAGDGQMDLDDLDRLLDPIVDGRADYTKGNRFSDRSCRREMSAWRFAGNVVLTVLTRIASGYWHLSDSQNGYTAISREALDAIDIDDFYEDYGFCNDLLVKLNVCGLQVVDVPMAAKYGDEESYIRYRRFIPKLSFLLVRTLVWRLRKKYLSDEDANKQKSGRDDDSGAPLGQNH